MGRLTVTDITGLVEKADYHHFPGTTVTVACLTLKNGYSVVGESACVVPADFDEALGRQLAYDDAVDKIWALEGYLLKQKIFDGVE